jgi:hypothetical protein
MMTPTVRSTYYLQTYSRYASLFESEFRTVKELLNVQTHQLNILLAQDTPRFSWARSVYESNWVLPYIAQLNGSICCSEDSKQRLYNISLRLHALFCLKAFCLEMKVKRESLFSVEVSFIGTGVVLKNVVPEDSMIMVACQSGDTSLVWNLLNDRKASVNDITPDNLSPLSVSLCRFILDS